MRLLTLFFLCFQMLGVLKAEDTDVVVKNLSLWQMCDELVDNSALQQKLQITDIQLQKLRELMSGKDIQDLLLEQARLANRRSEAGTAIANNIPFAVIDLELRQAVGNFLSEKQVLDLKRFSLAMRYPTGLSPFGDQAILDSCGIVADREFDDLLIQKHKRYEEKKRQLTTQAITIFLAELSESERVLLAQFLGNKYMSGILLSPDPKSEIGEVPFLDPSWAIQSYTLRELLNPNSSLASQIGISSKQELQLAELRQSITNRMGGEERLKTHFGKLKDILQDQQIISLARIRNEQLILRDFSWPFRQTQIKDYLGLDPQEANALLVFSEGEDRKLREQIAALNRNSFQEFCEKIPATQRLKIQRLFAEVW